MAGFSGFCRCLHQWCVHSADHITWKGENPGVRQGKQPSGNGPLPCDVFGRVFNDGHYNRIQVVKCTAPTPRVSIEVEQVSTTFFWGCRPRFRPGLVNQAPQLGLVAATQ